MILALLLSVVLLQDGTVRIEGEKTIDVARPTELTVSPRGIDLRERLRGFSVADDYDDEPANCTHWLLTPKPCEKVYKILPFAFEGRVIGPVVFDPPAPREPVTGEMECDPQKDLPPFSWKLAGWVALGVLGALAILAAFVLGVRSLARRVKEHRMSPIERAWVELDRLLKKGLPGRGRYKDFYVELTMVVRRYVQRQHGVVAPHLTTEEFFDAARHAPSFPQSTLDELIDFLRKADMVKFAGVEATPETTDQATESARTYISKDDVVVKRMQQHRVHEPRTTSHES